MPSLMQMNKTQGAALMFDYVSLIISRSGANSLGSERLWHVAVNKIFPISEVNQSLYIISSEWSVHSSAVRVRTAVFCQSARTTTLHIMNKCSRVEIGAQSQHILIIPAYEVCPWGTSSENELVLSFSWHCLLAQPWVWVDVPGK